ncbi:MAG TPA: APC family permease [Solirubrobacterales bacterium]|nr:APC family permease [Solirubrobacterales bacterium]
MGSVSQGEGSEVRTVGGLRRRLGLIQSAALVFAGVGASGGVYTLWTFSYGSSGPAFFWAYPIVAILVGLICLVWMELSSQYPFAGSFYEWPRLMLGRTRAAEPVGWWIGWLYLFGMTAALVATYVAIATAAIALFGWTFSPRLEVIVALAAMALVFLCNISGIERLGKLGVIGVLGEFVAVGVIVTLTLILGAEQSPTILTNTGGQSFNAWLPGFIGAAAFMPIWALWSFEGAGLLGEETKDARRIAPRAILIAFIATVGVAMYIVFAFIISTKNPTAAMAAASPIEDNINRVLPNFCSKIFLFVVVEVLVLSANSFLTYTSRQLFGMARAGELPGSSFLTRSRNGTPWASICVICAVSVLPLILSNEIAVLIGGTTACAYVAYVLILLVVVISRLRGWPSESAPFSLGRWGLLVSVGALLAAIVIGANLLWPRDSTNPVWHLGIRAAYWMVAVPILVGALMRLGRRLTLRPEPVGDPVDRELQAAAGQAPSVASEGI